MRLLLLEILMIVVYLRIDKVDLTEILLLLVGKRLIVFGLQSGSLNAYFFRLNIDVRFALVDQFKLSELC